MPNLTLANFNKITFNNLSRAVIDHFNIQSDFWKISHSQWDTARWYECGAVYDSRGSKAICHKFVGHPGRHAKRRTGTDSP